MDFHQHLTSFSRSVKFHTDCDVAIAEGDILDLKRSLVRQLDDSICFIRQDRQKLCFNQNLSETVLHKTIIPHLDKSLDISVGVV